MKKKSSNSRYQCERSVLRKLKALEYKGGKCINCGYDKYYGALEFHHRDPSEKEFSWCKLRRRSWEDVLKELDKCDLLCANCHREAHMKKLPEEFEFSHRTILNVPPVDHKINTCLICSEKCKNKYCSPKCVSLSQRKVERPSKSELLKLLETTSMVKVGKMYGVSDNTIRKWLKKSV